ncbi:MAG: hypothetical protein AAF208_08160 [Cyanobacteria bacterium P01_A01_bin.45]
MSQDKVRDQEKLREMLFFFLREMGATQLELSKGMGVSRPVVIDFLNREKEYLPVSSEGLVRLCESLKNRKPSKRKSKKEDHTDGYESSPDELRAKLGEVGADELLESAGFLPSQTKSIRVTRERFFQIAKIVALLELLEFEDLLSTTQEFTAIASNKLTIASKKLLDGSLHPDNDALENLIQELAQPHPTLGLKLKLEVIEKLKRTKNALKGGGKKKFTPKEAIALFLSIVIKEQMNQDAVKLHSRIKKLEFQTLSATIDYDGEYKDVYRRLVKIAYSAEYKLDTPGASSSSQALPETQTLDALKPVIMAIVTCSFGHDSAQSEIMEWIYTSSGTMIENAISACTLHMGLKNDTNLTISTNTLDSNIDALVETTVTLLDQQNYQGIWVDRDSMIAMLQAIICAVKQWLADNSNNNQLNLEVYIQACKSLADLRKRLTRIRKAFHKFQFLDEGCNLSEIKKIAEEAKHQLKVIPKEEMYLRYRLNFYRCYCLAKRLELRYSNFQGNIINAQSLITELNVALDRNIDKYELYIKNIEQVELSPIEALIQSEIYLYELSCGHQVDLFQNKKINQWLELNEWKSKIRSVINTNSCYKDAGLDVYESLSEIHGNAARIQFYLCDDKDILEETATNFIKAAHYALRIGLTQRVSRWIALAGRAWVRLGNGKLSLQALKLAEKLAKTDLTTGHSYNFCQSVLSEISLLHGEYLLLVEDNPVQALENFLGALKGSVYLGLNRRICDSAFNISRCSYQLSNLSVKEGLNWVFKEEEKLITSNQNKLNPMSNHTSEKVLDLLCNLSSREDNPTWFQVRKEFSTLAAQVWQTWHDDTLNIETQTQTKKATIHPIAQKIENQTWLSQIN